MVRYDDHERRSLECDLHGRPCRERSKISAHAPTGRQREGTVQQEAFRLGQRPVDLDQRSTGVVSYLTNLRRVLGHGATVGTVSRASVRLATRIASISSSS